MMWIQKLRNINRKQKGFTLVELMVVMAIIGVLAALVIPKFSGSTDAAKDSKLTADLRTLDGVMMQYYASKQEFPAAFTITGETPPTVLSSYLNKWPKDAKGNAIAYLPSSDKQSYKLSGKKSDNSDAVSPGSNAALTPPATNP